VPHSLTHLATHLVRIFWRLLKLEEGEERGACLVLDFLGGFLSSLGIVLAIYIKEVFTGFSPP
jgi:hypothetical protein